MKENGFYENDFFGSSLPAVYQPAKGGKCYKLGTRYPAVVSRDKVDCVELCVELMMLFVACDEFVKLHIDV